jgi:farnesyl diphosphate synthase
MSTNNNAVNLVVSQSLLSLDFAAWSRQCLNQTELRLEQLLPSVRVAPSQLHEGMRYAVLDGGKRIRPLLAFGSGQLVGADPADCCTVGCAVELIHAYSLVHDDMPCMDNDALRRGKATVHIAFGEASAMLVGDSLQPLAFAALASLKHLPPQAVVNMVDLLAVASGSLGMAGGQAIDLAGVGQQMALSDLEQMHRLKTGALLRAAILLGAQCAPVNVDQQVRNALEIYARAIGLAFQVVDDILDVASDTATLGKTAGKDAQAGKPTYVSLMGLNQAKILAAQLHREALSAIKPFGTKATRLHELADLIVLRRS